MKHTSYTYTFKCDVSVLVPHIKSKQKSAVRFKNPPVMEFLKFNKSYAQADIANRLKFQSIVKHHVSKVRKKPIRRWFPFSGDV